jgi:thioredoxin reductase
MAGGFRVLLGGGEQLSTQKLVLATGRCDRLPEAEGFRRFFGKGIWSCPFCDGWEYRGQRLAALGYGDAGVELALGLLSWSTDVILLTDSNGIPSADRERLRINCVHVNTQPIARFAGESVLQTIDFADGTTLERSALFFHLGAEQRSPLPKKFGCHERRHFLDDQTST